MIGLRVGNIHIVDRLGAGGMGEVFRGVDETLGREVAVKVLPLEMAADPERVARFEREARSLAALRHPHVATVHGFEEVDGRRLLIMELVPGETLAERLARGRFDLDELKPVALGIASGLEAAHARGIVHRDLKPSNVMLDADGGVKILDFGLASAGPGPGDGADPEHSPTLTAAMTHAGVVLGTAATMSPEQARGRPVDHRTDIWAFGVLLWEMWTGRQLFTGETVGDVLAAVLREPIPFEELPPETPPALHRLLHRCLQRDLRQRLQAIGDARLELESDDVGEPAAPPTPPPGLRRTWIAAALALAVGLGAGSLVPRGGGVAEDSASVVRRSRIALPEGTRLAGWSSPGVALSPDGSAVAVVVTGSDGHQRLAVKSLETGLSFEVPDSDGAEGPFFSPDGQWIGYAAGSISGRSSAPSRLWKVSVAGGAPRVVGPLGDFFGGAWAGDGYIYWVDFQPSGLWRVPESGGNPERLSETSQRIAWPQILPGGDRALVSLWDERRRLGLVDLSSGEVEELPVRASFARWLTSGHLLSADARGRARVSRWEPGEGAPSNHSVEVLDGVSMLANGAAAITVSEEGTLLYGLGPVEGSDRMLARVVRIGSDGRVTPLGFPEDYVEDARASPDGSRLAVAGDDGAIRILDLERESKLELPGSGDAFRASGLLWHPDGDRVVFGGGSRSDINLFLQPTDGLSPARQLEHGIGEHFALDWLPGTGELIYRAFDTSETPPLAELRILDLDTGESRTWEELDERAFSVRFSPDGRWLAASLSGTDGARTVLQAFPDPQRRIPVGPGVAIAWGADGRSLYLVEGERRGRRILWRVPIDRAGGEPSPDLPVEFLVENERVRYALDSIPGGTVDGSFATVAWPTELGTVSELRMVQGFTGELERLLPGN